MHNKSKEELITELNELEDRYTTLESELTNTKVQHNIKIKSLEDVTKVGIYESSFVDGTTSWSDNLYEIFGLEKGTIINNTLFEEVVHPEDFGAFWNFITKMLENKVEICDVKYRIINPSKGTLWVHSNGKVIYNSNGKPIKFIGTIKDITDDVTHDEIIQTSEILLKEALNLAKLGYWELDVKTSKVNWSEELYKLFGYLPTQEIDINKVMNEMIHPDDKEKSELYLKTLLETGKSKDLEFRALKKNGKYLHMNCRTMLIKDSEGNTVKIFGVDQDITEKKQSEEDIKDLQNYLSNIIDSMPSILIGIDNEGLVTQWNSMAVQATGVKPKNSLGKDIFDVFPRLKNISDKILFAISSNKMRTYTKSPFIINGKQFYEDIIVYPLEPNGKGAVIRIDDVTKKNEIEYLLNHSRKMEAIGQLAGGVAHDFNNMLSGIMSSAQILKSSKRNLDDNGIKFVDMILEATTRAADLTSKLLVFGRKNQISSKCVDLHDVIGNTLSIFNRTIDKKINITSSINATNAMFKGDYSAIQNSLINLGINSSHAMENGGELNICTNNVSLDTNFCNKSPFDIKPGDYIKVEISDNGCGIPPENMEKIFERFFTTKEQGKGTGLGLASIYGTIQDHLGAIMVSSKINEGTRFKIYIPTITESVCKESPHNSILQGCGKILLVDDEEIIRETSKTVIEDLGYDVLLAENGMKAVEIFENNYNDIDIVVMDMIMPKMNGREAFYKMKEIDSNSNIILSSGYMKDENINQLKEDGIKGFLQKPYTLSKLCELLKEITNT